MEKEQSKIRTIINVLAYGMLLLIVSCKGSFEPIDYGKDACAHCKMTIMSKPFAAEMVSAKGKAFKFDDVHCMTSFVKENRSDANNALFYVADYSGNTTNFLDATKAYYLHSEALKSPMNGNCAAFATEAAAGRWADSMKLNVLVKNWKELE